LSNRLIALWLGHESVETTQIYLDADLAMKQAVLDKTTPPEENAGRYRPDDPITRVPQRACSADHLCPAKVHVAQAIGVCMCSGT
jgi:hypothetical protein